MKVYDTKEFGEMIKKRRKSLGYTQKYLSEFTGYSASFISDLENGKTTIELGRALKIANLLGLDLLLEER
ncbi:MAG: helix-turn-helix transcriptional regulator [Lachnospiraceae bacterium]|jgi:y4mF family transcriptional regulator|nr:helix-turn-helix transcriptional regulator [Lachnospiraceae bacterium]MBQ3794377.1 helix-turn-helix transcriptional regulator [Lachnospiraceae bacterium]